MPKRKTFLFTKDFVPHNGVMTPPTRIAEMVTDVQKTADEKGTGLYSMSDGDTQIIYLRANNPLEDEVRICRITLSANSWGNTSTPKEVRRKIQAEMRRIIER